MAAILREHGTAFVQAHAGHRGGVQRRALADLAAGRTAALGGHVAECAGCGDVPLAYHACRKRHCPQCPAGGRARWLERARGLRLPVD